MVTVEVWQKIRHLQATGWSVRRIARELGVARGTVRKALAAEQPPQYTRTAAASPLEPWKEILERGLRLQLCGSRVLLELRAAGYTGARSVFYERWKALRAEQQRPQAFCRFETDPGVQAQFDWAEYVLRIGAVATKVYVFSLLLAYSRRVHWFPSLACDHPAAFEALEAGWRHFGGACRFVLVDNAKVFLRRHQGSEVQWNANFLRLCGHYRVQPIASTPHHPQSKGKVENPFGHLEQLFLTGSSWRDWEHFQQELAAFETRWEQRIHGTTKVTPGERFQEEQSVLLSLPATPFLDWQETFRTASKDSLISYEGVPYSVPWSYAHKAVLVRTSQGREVRIYSTTGSLLARHEKRPSGSPPVIDPQHYEGLRRRHQAALHGLARDFRKRFGAHAIAGEFLQRLLAQHRHRPDRPLGQVLDLLTPVPEALAVAALAEAVEFNLCTPRFVELRLQQLLRGSGASGAAPASGSSDRARPDLITQLALPELEVERPLVQYAAALPPHPLPSNSLPSPPVPGEPVRGTHIP